jgi:SAM-dependent methyltransferase
VTKPAIEYLPAVAIEGHQSSGTGGPDHPMRAATRRAAGLDAGGWTGDLRSEVAGLFDGLASEWHTRSSPHRTAVVMDALVRGLDASRPSPGLAIEIGSGTGAYSALIAERFTRVVAVDLSMEMLRRAPNAPAHRVQADASALPLPGSCAAAIVLINAFLFPAEVNRVLSPGGTVLWVNTSGEQTPIYLSPDDFVAALGGEWTGTASRAGEGHWCVVRRGDRPT